MVFLSFNYDVDINDPALRVEKTSHLAVLKIQWVQELRELEMLVSVTKGEKQLLPFSWNNCNIISGLIFILR